MAAKKRTLVAELKLMFSEKHLSFKLCNSESFEQFQNNSPDAGEYVLLDESFETPEAAKEYAETYLKEKV